MSCFMVINGSCSTNIRARQLSFNFSSMVWGAWPRGPPLDPPLRTSLFRFCLYFFLFAYLFIYVHCHLIW